MKLTRRQLRRLIRESFSIRKTLFVFDFDDTLAHTDSMVRLERDKEITDLDSGAFADYSFQPGDQLDFTDFNRVSGKLIANTLAILNNAQRSGQDIVIITARPPGAVPGIQQFFADNNMESPSVYATSGSANKEARPEPHERLRSSTLPPPPPYGTRSQTARVSPPLRRTGPCRPCRGCQVRNSLACGGARRST